MNVGIIGLGLIGGSFAKAIKKNTAHTVLGADTDRSVMSKAALVGAVDGVLDDGNIGGCDMIIIALYPGAVIKYLGENAHKFGKNAIVIDCGGTKREICAAGGELAAEYGFRFIGGHPMAGREVWGFKSAQVSLFANASMILTPPSDIDIATLASVKEFFTSLGFGGVVIRTPEEHDRIIAYTSQLAHVLSSAYVKSPTAREHRGLSAGSFRDMTRVAAINSAMWSDIFIENKDNLVRELDRLIGSLTEYRGAIADGDTERLRGMLDEGSEIKRECFAKE